MEQTAKQKAIEAAYGEYWEQVKDYVDENGFCDYDYWFKFIGHKIDYEYKEPNSLKMRPKSLSGIENNNGWISVPSKHEYEIENGQYLVIYRNGYIEVAEWNGTNECYKFWKLNFTHYQPIVKPKPPIY